MKTESVKIVAYKEIGEVSFIRKSSGRSLKITVKPFKGVQVILPRFVSFEAAGKFVEDKLEWIRRQQVKMSRYERKITVFNEDTEFRTKDHVLSIGKHEKPTIKTVIKNGVIRINYPRFASADDPRIQQVIRRAILAALKMEAVKYLPGLTERMAIRFGFTYVQVYFRNNKTRWGSCSRDNRISLNVHLMRLPDHLRDYIILHELCHTVHKHHQKSFWELLDKLTDGVARDLDKELNAYSPNVF